MTFIEIVLAILLIVAVGAAGWFFIAHRLKVRDTAEKLAAAIKSAKQASSDKESREA